MIIENPVVIAFGSVEFDGPSPKVPDRVCRTTLRPYRENTSQELGCLAHSGQEICASDVRNVV